MSLGFDRVNNHHVCPFSKGHHSSISPRKWSLRSQTKHSWRPLHSLASIQVELRSYPPLHSGVTQMLSVQHSHSDLPLHWNAHCSGTPWMEPGVTVSTTLTTPGLTLMLRNLRRWPLADPPTTSTQVQVRISHLTTAHANFHNFHLHIYVWNIYGMMVLSATFPHFCMVWWWVRFWSPNSAF